MTAEFWNQRYDNPSLLFGHRPNDFLKDNANLLRPSSRVLCVGDGEARNGVWLATRGIQVTSLDFSDVAQTKGRKLAAEKGVEVDFQLQDLAQWVLDPDPEPQWDGVVWIFSHLPSTLRARVCQAVTRRTKPGGILVYEAYTPAQPGLGSGGPKDRDMLMTRDDVLADWPDWRLDVRLVERRIFEGPAHQGLSSVVQALGQRK